MVDEISLYLPNKPGQFASALKVLSKARVNVLAFSIDQAGDYSIIRLICHPHETAREKLEAKGFGLKSDKVFAVLLPQKSGVLEPIAEIFGANEINIEYGYLTCRLKTDKAVVLLKASDVAKAAQLLVEHKYEDLTEI